MSREKLCDLILNRCNGIDTVPIDDDRGCESKMVSVEDSFIRGSILSEKAARDKLHLLCERLPHLLLERKRYALRPELAIPETLRLTIRTVDPTIQNGRRPFRTLSKQTSISNGRLLLGRSCDDDSLSPKNILRQAFDPMLDILLRNSREEINLTRINIAATKFLDISNQESSYIEDSKQQQLNTFFMPSQRNTKTVLRDSSPSNIRWSTLQVPSQNKISFEKGGIRSNKRKLDEVISNQIDPNVLALLPTDIAKEVRNNMSFHQSSFVVDSTSSHLQTSGKARKVGLHNFFSKEDNL